MNSVRNGEAKELICLTHEHELKGGNVGGRGCAGSRATKERIWDKKYKIKATHQLTKNLGSC